MKVFRFEVLIIGICILLEASPYIAAFTLLPEGHVFPLVHNYGPDYLYYLHLMRQGFDGQILATSWLTPEVFPPQFVNPFFLILGHIARIFHISLPVMYAVGRFSGGITLLFLTMILSRFVFGIKNIYSAVALLFVCFGTGFWSMREGGIALPSLVLSWSEFDPIHRFSFIPHHLWSKVFMLGSFIMLLLLLSAKEGKKKMRYLVMVCLAAIFAGFTSPVSILTTVITFVLFGAATGIYMVCHKKWQWQPFFFLSVLLCISVAVALYHKGVEESVFPWTGYISFEKNTFIISFSQYLLSLGVLFPLFLFSVPFLFRHGYPGILLVSWGLSGLIGAFVLSERVEVLSVRFLEGYQFIPMGIGAAVVCEALIRWFDKKIHRSGRILLPILLVLFLVYSAVGWVGSYQRVVFYNRNDVTNPYMYPPRDWMDALSFLAVHGEKQSVVLGPAAFNTFVPAFTGMRSFSGHDTMTLDPPLKWALLTQFFRYSDIGAMQELIQTYGISIIVCEKSNPPPLSVISGLGLTKVYENPTLIVYTEK